MKCRVLNDGSLLPIYRKDAEKLVKLSGREISVRIFRQERSVPENRWYWSVFLPWAAAHMPEALTTSMGIPRVTPEIMHEAFKVYAGVTSTSFIDLDEEQFGMYLTQCKNMMKRVMTCSDTDLELSIRDYNDDHGRIDQKEYFAQKRTEHLEETNHDYHEQNQST